MGVNCRNELMTGGERCNSDSWVATDLSHKQQLLPFSLFS